MEHFISQLYLYSPNSSNLFRACSGGYNDAGSRDTCNDGGNVRGPAHSGDDDSTQQSSYQQDETQRIACWFRLTAGADVNAIDCDGRTLLDKAEEHGYSQEVTALLYSRGALKADDAEKVKKHPPDEAGG